MNERNGLEIEENHHRLVRRRKRRKLFQIKMFPFKSPAANHWRAAGALPLLVCLLTLSSTFALIASIEVKPADENQFKVSLPSDLQNNHHHHPRPKHGFGSRARSQSEHGSQKMKINDHRNQLKHQNKVVPQDYDDQPHHHNHHETSSKQATSLPVELIANRIAEATSALQSERASPIVVSSSDSSYVSASPIATWGEEFENSANVLDKKTLEKPSEFYAIKQASRRDYAPKNRNHHLKRLLKHQQQPPPNELVRFVPLESDQVERGVSADKFLYDLSSHNQISLNDSESSLGFDGNQAYSNDSYDGQGKSDNPPNHREADELSRRRESANHSDKFSSDLLDSASRNFAASGHGSGFWEQLETGENKRKSLGKPNIQANYFKRQGTIIKTKESLELGATFLNYTIVTNLEACLVECWITDLCDTTIYQESPVDLSTNNNHPPSNGFGSNANIDEHHDYLTSLRFRDDKEEEEEEEDDDDDDDDYNSNNIGEDNGDNSVKVVNGDDEDNDDDNLTPLSSGENSKTNYLRRQKRDLAKQEQLGFYICYLFKCAKPDGFKCQFSAHNYYTSSIKQTAALADQKRLSPIIKSLRPIREESVLKGTKQKEQQYFDGDDKNQITIVEASDRYDSEQLDGVHDEQISYSKLIAPSYQQHYSFNGRQWHDQRHHVASIRIGAQDYDDSLRAKSMNSAIIAIMLGIAVTAMLILVVGHKMRSIQTKIAYKVRHRSLVADTDFLINTLPTNALANLQQASELQQSLQAGKFSKR